MHTAFIWFLFLRVSGVDLAKVCAERLCFPRVLWGFWSEEQIPEDIEEMIVVTKNALTNFTCIFLAQSNLSYYLNTSFLTRFYNQPPAIMGDYVRINLIAQYGGIWIDCSTYVNSAFEFERFFSEGVKGEREVYGLRYGEKNEFLVSLNFFGACSSSFLMKKLKEEFDICWKGDAEIYLKKACDILLFKNVIAEYHCSKYFSMFATFINLMYNSEALKTSVNFIEKDQRLNFEFLIEECKFSAECVRSRLLYDPVARSYPIIKLWHLCRNGEKFHIGDAIYDLNLKVRLKAKKKLYFVLGGLSVCLPFFVCLFCFKKCSEHRMAVMN